MKSGGSLISEGRNKINNQNQLLKSEVYNSLKFLSAYHQGTTTLSITTFSLTTLSITTFSLTTLSITTFSLTTLSITTLSIRFK